MTDSAEGKDAPSPSAPVTIPEEKADLVEVRVRRVLEKETRLQPRELDRVTHQITTLTLASWSGPLPPPAVLREYNEIVPGCAGEIVSSFTNEVTHRQGMDRKGFVATIFGMSLGFIGLVGMLGIAGYALYCGFPWVAGTIATVMASVVGLFVWKQQQEPPKPAPSQPRQSQNRAQRRAGR